MEMFEEAVADWEREKSVANLYALYASFENLISENGDCKYIQRDEMNLKVSTYNVLHKLTLDANFLGKALLAITESLRIDIVSNGWFEEAGVEPKGEYAAGLFVELLSGDDVRKDNKFMVRLFKRLCRYDLIPDPSLLQMFEYILDFALLIKDYSLAKSASAQVLMHLPIEGNVSVDTYAKCVPFDTESYYAGPFSPSAILRAFEIYEGTTQMNYIVNHFDWYLNLFEESVDTLDMDKYRKGMSICLDLLESRGKHKEIEYLRKIAL